MSRARNIAEGIAIILRYEPEAEVAVGHDQLFCGDYNAEEMSPEDRRRAGGTLTPTWR